jgi:N-methylhydantoinase A
LPYRVAVDIGGTFTDLVVEHDGGESIAAAKVLSTPGHLVDGVIGAVRASGVPVADFSLFVHGTTAGLNAFLERRGANVALVTTRGFRDTYLIGRGHRPRMYDLHYVKPTPLLDRSAIFEIDERMAADGSIIREIDEDSVRKAVSSIGEREFDAVAVCFLHAYANSAHERLAAESIRAQLGVPVVASHEIAPVWREYERTATTVMSAYITPIMARYVEELAEALADEGLTVPIYITESNGGVMGARVAERKAILTLFSGPVGGVVGTQAAGKSLGFDNLISIDIGGTSFDVSLVRAGEVSLQSEFELQGLPVLAPALEVHTIGAGGGSLLREVGGALRVGPQSAGATPGPVCYGLGGTEPTVTDANLVLGRIPSDQRLAGSMELDLPAARLALDELGSRFGLSAEAVAEEALAIAHFAMAEAIRELTVERGLDPQDFVLCAFGGAGGLHATALADELDIATILVPAMPGAFSAWGMLSGDIRHDAVATFFRALDDVGGHLAEVVARLQLEVRELLELDGVSADAVRFDVAADLRYVGQEYSMTLPVRPDEVSRSDAAAATDIAARFHAAYLERYGHASHDAPIEFVAVRVTGVAILEKSAPRDETIAEAGEPVGAARMRFRGDDLDVAVHRRESLAGPVPGPAIVLEETGTTVVDPGWTIRPVTGGHLLLERIR